MKFSTYNRTLEEFKFVRQKDVQRGTVTYNRTLEEFKLIYLFKESSSNFL